MGYLLHVFINFFLILFFLLKSLNFAVEVLCPFPWSIKEISAGPCALLLCMHGAQAPLGRLCKGDEL